MQENICPNSNTTITPHFIFQCKFSTWGFSCPADLWVLTGAGTVQSVKLHTEDIWAQKCWYWIAVLASIQFFLITQRLHVKARSVLFLCKWQTYLPPFLIQIQYMHRCFDTQIQNLPWSLAEILFLLNEGETLILIRDAGEAHSWGLQAEVCACLQPDVGGLGS